MCYCNFDWSKRSGNPPALRLSLILIIALLIFFCSHRGFATELRQFEGVLYSIEERELALPVDGLIEEVAVSEGQSVVRGDVLLRLRSQSAELAAERRRLVWQDNTAVATGSERLEIIATQYQTLAKLFETTGTVSKDELNALRLEKIQAKAQLDNSLVQKSLAELEYGTAAQKLQERSLRAPIDGLVTRIEKFNGEWLSAGETVITMADLSSVVLRTSVPDALARLLQPDQAVIANIDGVGQVTGSVTFIAPVADPASGLVRIRIEISNPQGMIRPGTRGRVLL